MAQGLIEDAIVIKNIPIQFTEEHFRTTLLPRLHLYPRAFNYYRTDGQFHGLAFANFRTAQEAQIAVAVLNGYALMGRPLQVEIKKRRTPEEQQRRLERRALRRSQQPENGGPTNADEEEESMLQGIDFTKFLEVHLQPNVVFCEPSPPVSQAGIYLCG
jgi:RNA recognition motif-containing protein